MISSSLNPLPFSNTPSAPKGEEKYGVTQGKHGLVDAMVDGIMVQVDKVDVNIRLPNGTTVHLALGSLALSSTTSDYEASLAP